MKLTKRILSLVLCLVMLVGLMPAITVNAGAAETVIDAAVFCSDVHGSTSDLTSALSGVATSGVDYSSIGFVGDTCLTVANTTSIVQSALGDNNIAVMFSYASSHDTEYGADIDDNWDYSGEVEGVSDHYLVYTIRETDMQNASGANTAAPAFTSWYNGLTDAEKALPIFIMSHRPLHDRRDDNAGAATWYTAISAAAETSDIVFFWAHNHTGESSVDTAAYYVEKDGTESFTVYNGDTVVPNFTYMNAGYINANGQNPARKGVATTVKITADSLIFQDYNSSGEYSGTYAHNVTVAREFAVQEVTLSSIAISGKTEYYVDDELALTVTATYSDGTTADVTADATLSGYDMNAAGDYTVTATYGEKTAAVEITVTAVQINSIAVTTLPDKLTYTTGEELDTTGMVVTATYNNGTTAEVTGWYTSAVDMTTAGEKTVTVNYAVDGISYKTTFPITVEEGIAEGVTLQSIEITTPPAKTEYLISEELSLDGMVVTATFSDGSTVELAYKPFSTSTAYGGYELDNFSMYVEKEHEVKVTYTFGDITCTDTTTINVWNEDFTDEATGVKVHVTADYGVTAAAVAESSNEYVPTAISGVISGTNYVAYDISLTFDEDYETTNAAKTVTLPIPEGVNNPVVYYVSEDGATVTNMNAVKGEGVVTFETNHFSTYVIGESAEIEVPENETATGNGETTTTTTKTVYVLTSSISAGNDYLIVNGNSAGSYYALANNGGSVAATGVTVKTDSEIGTYIELNDVTDELWTVSNSYRFQNGGYYLRYNNGLGLSTSNYTTWSYSSNRLSYRSSRTTYYLRYNSGWTTTSSSSSASSIYFYVPTEVEIETTTTVSGTYSIAGEDLTKVVVEGTTADLTSTLTFTPTDGGTATTTDVSTTATYEVVTVDANGNAVNGDPNGIISKIENGVVTFTGNYGTALVKVSYTTGVGVVTDYITVTAAEPTYTLEITRNDAVVSGTTVSIKGVTSGQTVQLGTNVFYETADGKTELDTLPEGATLEWHIPAEYQNIATVDHDTGLVTLKGVDGAFYVTATLTVNGKDYTVGVNFSVSTSQYSNPTDGTGDFPEYPNEGAIRFDKTATAVGNFSQTGIAQVELSMTGVPYTTGSEIDVVVMLDMTGSMDDVTSSTSKPTGYVRVDATIAASKAFIETIVKNEDGSYNGNRVGVYVFNKNGAATLFDFGTVDSDTELAAIYADLESIYDDHYASGGTPYDDGLSKCYEVLTAAKTDGIGNNRQQFTVFMTDGVPTSYAYVNGSTYGTHSSASAIAGMLTSSDNYATRDTDYKYEYYSTEMKKAGVTVYSVGVGLENTNNAWSGSATQCLNLASALLNDISGPGGETTQPDAVGTSTHSKQDAYFFSVEDATAATDMEKVFTNIAQKILQAATDVTVEDKITDEYTMIFDIPTGSKDITGVTNDFYIEFGKYALDEDHERTTFTSVTKLYLKKTNGELSAASDSNGTAYAAPVFEAKTIGDKGSLYYWSTNAADGDAGISVEVDGTTYYFVSYGLEEAGYNMTSGAYAYGTVDTDTNMSEDLIIATPYFVYNASTKMLYWTVDKLDTEEYALRYFLYLDNSATEVGTSNETDPGSYQTNDHAYITYTNFKGNDCRQEFPKPQLTWNGAQVSYVFYLVNSAGQPINKSGQVVDFANATFITDVYTESVVWNKEGDTTTGTGSLSADWLANDKLPDEYDIYDEQARYVLNVYENADGTTIKNQFTISGSTAAEISRSLNTRLELDTTESTVSTGTTKVYNTKAGEKISAYGTYTSADSSMKDFDFANTTVAFAVVWQPRLVPDTVVVDYGLDVLINVVQNDILQNAVSGIGVGDDAYGNIEMNTGVSTDSKLGTAALIIDGNTISIESETSIRFHQGDMEFKEPVKFFYETPVEFWEGSDPTEGYMYSSVTVIPATTIYYEDEYVELNTFTRNEDGTYSETKGWAVAPTSTSATQDQDRPGESLISKDIDADNNYGFDAAYANMSTYSMGSAAKTTVSAGTYATAQFTFYGTGFDIISLTDATTGVITVNVYQGAEATGTAYVSETVDTYYGYKLVDGKWITTTANDPNALYQVPVMKIGDGKTTEELPYGQYTAVITATYVPFLDHNTADASYNFYLDAIRIYNPTGNLNDQANDAYIKDGEGWPKYFEVRDQIITKKTFDSLDDQTVSGIVFIDGSIEEPTIEDYTSYGPNNEVYLDLGDAVAFYLKPTADTGTEVAKIQLAIKTVGGTGKVEVYGIDSEGIKTACLSETISTATDMYYDITALNDKTVVIKNAGSGEDAIVSITNVKVTYTGAQNTSTETEEDAASAEAPALFSISRSTADAAVMSLSTQEDSEPETQPTEPSEEPTEPSEEPTEPSEEPTEPSYDENVKKAVKEIIRKLLGWIFG